MSEETKKSRPLDNFEPDFIEYAVNRLTLNEKEDDIDLVKDSIYHTLHLIWQFGSSDRDFRYLLGFLSNIYDYYEEFESKFGDRYDKVCDCCKDKIVEGKLSEPDNSCEGC